MAEAAAAKQGSSRANTPDPDFDWRRDRLAGPGQPRARPAGGDPARPRAQGALPVQRARPRHGADHARHPARPSAATPPAAIIARGPCCSRSACRWRTRWAPAWAGPAAIRTAAISASSSTIPIPAAARRCRCAAASARNIRRPPAGRRRSTIISDVLERRRLCRRDRGGARRRRELRDQRLLVGADHRHDAEAADALLRRGQSIRHLGALDLPDAGRRHRRATSRASAISTSSPATAPSRPRRRG